MKKVFLLIVLLAAVFTIAACQNDDTIIVQGVTDTEILVGNTAATSGAFAGVGIPFNNGLQAYFEYINEQGGINGRMIRFVTYDDGFDATQGLTYTKKLVEEDKVFALVGHFGTPTVGATVDYIQDIGVPMVYAATGINALYFEESPLNPVMAVQPIYKTDGRIMTARALNEALFGTNFDAKLGATDKVGVLHTTTDDGMSLKAGIETEAEFSGVASNFIYKSFAAADTAALDAAVLQLKDAGVKAVIVASNQAPFKAAVRSLQTNALHVPTFTSYVNADATSIDTTIDYSFDIYANAWVDIAKNAYGDLGEFNAIMAAAEVDVSVGIAYAIAGYIAAKVFVEGIERVGEDELTWKSYIEAMEEGPIDIPMGGTVDFSEGKRWGIASMSLLKLATVPVDPQTDPATYVHSWAANKPIETLETIQAK
ncbi:MAG: hypothetical protein EP317_00915 [Bacillota bacterium]|nr:MAG: hypothetical protein EP317_00915 [Bacillota bacterium]